MVAIAGDNRNREIKQITMIVNGSQLSECTIISDEFPRVTKLQCFEMNFGILKRITKITFNTGWEEIESFLNNNRNIFDVLCQNLIAFDVSMVTEDGGLPRYYCKDGILFRRAGNEECLIKYPIGRRDDVVIVPGCSGEKAARLVIGRSAFEGAAFVKKIKFLGFVSEVHDYTFKNCISLETIESEKLPFIGKDAFENCYSLTTVAVEPYYSMIGINKENLKLGSDGYFYDIYTKRPVRFVKEMEEAIEVYGYQSFGNFEIFNQKGIRYRLSYLGHCGKEIQCARFSSYNEDVIIIAGYGELIGDKLSDVFKYADGHAIIYIGDHITAIKTGHEIEDVYDNVFSGHYSKIIVGNGVKEIDPYVFSGANIGELVLGASLEIIGEGAFFETSIEKLFIPDSVNMIGEGIIQGDPCECKVVSIPSTVRQLEKWALLCRSGGPKIFIRGEKPPKDLCMWLLAGLNWYLVKGMVSIPESWRQYLNDDYFETTRRMIQEGFRNHEWDRWSEQETCLKALDKFQHNVIISEIMVVNDLLAKFSKCVPANGMHISYLDKAAELLDVYTEMLSVMDEDRTLENEQRAVDLALKIREIVE